MEDRIKMPKVLRYFIVCYIGVVGIMMLTRTDMSEDIPTKIFWALTLSLYTALATYGFISFLEDMKNGGFKNVIRKIKRFL